jgi:DNA-binding MarR family transcriptional regulator
MAIAPEVSFTDMRETLNMTDGNLIAHMRTLHEAGYVAVTKALQGKRTLTTYSLTKEGRKAFVGYIDLLENIVQQTRPKK